MGSGISSTQGSVSEPHAILKHSEGSSVNISKVTCFEGRKCKFTSNIKCEPEEDIKANYLNSGKWRCDICYKKEIYYWYNNHIERWHCSFCRFDACLSCRPMEEKYNLFHKVHEKFRLAAMNGELEEAKGMLEDSNSDIDINDEDYSKEGQTPLSFASMRGHATLVELFLKHGAIIGLANKLSDTPLHVATKNNQTAVVEVLLKHGANSHLPNKNKLISIHIAIEKNLASVVDSFLNHGTPADMVANYSFTSLKLSIERSLTLLMIAAMHGNVEVVEVLLKHGATVNLPTTFGFTPLMMASIMDFWSLDDISLPFVKRTGTAFWKGDRVRIKSSGDVGIITDFVSSHEKNDIWGVKYFVKGHIKYVTYGYSCVTIPDNPETEHVDFVRSHVLSILLERNSDRELHALQNAARVVEVLITHGASVDLTTKNGSSALMLASAKCHCPVVEVLLKHGANVNLANNNGDTPLMGASVFGGTSTVSTLLQYNANVTMCKKSGETAMMGAYDKGHIAIADMLLNKGANYSLDNNKKLIVRAAENGLSSVVETLLKVGENVDVAEEDGKTALVAASEKGYVSIVKFLLKNDANTKKYGTSALIKALDNGHGNIIDILLNKGVSYSLKNDVRLFVRAAENGFSSVVETLLRLGENIDVAEGDGKTALVAASEKGYVSIVQLLLNNNANTEVLFSMKDKDGKITEYTALEIARKREHNDVSRMLENHKMQRLAKTEAERMTLKKAAVDQNMKENDKNVAPLDARSTIIKASQEDITRLKVFFKSDCDISTAVSSRYLRHLF